MTMRSRIWNYIKYNLLIFPVVIAIYIPYNVLFIGYTPIQLLKWATTSAFVSAIANMILQPWISFCYRQKWLK